MSRGKHTANPPFLERLLSVFSASIKYRVVNIARSSFMVVIALRK
jgi:hypothetical protein